MTPVCDGALLLLDKTASRMLQTELMGVGLSYCFRLGNSLKRTNHLEMHSLQLLVKALWNFSWEDEDHEQQMVLAVYNILSTRFEPEEEENVEPTAFRDL